MCCKVVCLKHFKWSGKYLTIFFVLQRICRMFATIDIKKMNKSEKFDKELQDLARFAKAISHPARLAILKYLAETKTCISGDISEYLPLSRTTVSQHLKELRDLGLIHGTIDGLKVNYCLCEAKIDMYLLMLETFFEPIKAVNINCGIDNQHVSKSRANSSRIKTN